MGFLRIDATSAAGALAAVADVWIPAPTLPIRTKLLWKTEVQYVCRNGARQSCGQQYAALLPFQPPRAAWSYTTIETT
jgi:hypothetical protein